MGNVHFIITRIIRLHISGTFRPLRWDGDGIRMSLLKKGDKLKAVKGVFNHEIGLQTKFDAGCYIE